ncbi:terminase [Methylopila jiangsuensis]|uniref:Terminase n=1 Tax=Methylopila jiangsuensis TaxID=586230 RepID=A0A9W6JGN8_9HYPH|nr:terminase TerL endonuclease subunit [Methylopila jiangsuensis]MDR6286948.1 phage terminase large subunit-like protein [Methylopila jiangsuensis]GLK76702.1 terminase [Methylopila jiangsuensis]
MKTTRPLWLNDGSEIDDPFGYGERAVAWLRKLKHPKSRLPGRAFQLDPWQERIVRRIYGPCHPDGRRIVKTVVLLLPRGNRKTSLAAALACLHTFGPEKVPNGQAVFAAADRDQARIGFAEAAGIMREDRRVEKALRFVDSRHRVSYPQKGATLRAISSDAGRQHGQTPNFALVDELHAWPKRDLWDVLRTGLTKVAGSLLVVATTAGRGKENVASDVVDYARKVARGEIEDPAFLPVLFEMPAGSDWRDQAMWHDVNPGLALGYPDLEGLRQLAREAENRPSDQAAFRQLHLNEWQANATTPFVDMTVYDQGAGEVDLDAHAEERTPCWLGVDLSSSIDLTVVVAAFATEAGFEIAPFFFCPTGNLQQRQDLSGAPYVRWAAEGQITATPGDVIDVRAVEDRIRDLCATYNVQEVAFDPALARQSLATLGDEGLPVVEHRQGALSMMPAIAELERAIIGRRFRHGAHPVLRWTFENTEVETNAHGHKVRLSKPTRWLSIDGAVAGAMAVSRAATGNMGGFIYADADARPEGIEIW